MGAHANLAIVIPVLVAACSPGGPAGDDGTWDGTISTEGDVTTVVNESGSVWGGTATLVEELSIGVESGADEYMFGNVNSLYATDEFIFVIDGQVPAVRVYDHSGAFVRTLGGQGQGPGEYTRPSIVAADETGEVFVLDPSLRRINVYRTSGEVLDPWPMPDPRCCVWPMYPLTGEAVWAPVQEWLDDRTDRRYGLQAIGPSGPYGDVMWIPELEFEQATFGDRDYISPFSPWLVWNPAPEGRLLVGTSDRYRFEVHDPDGSKLIVHRYWDPVPVPDEQREWERRRVVSMRRRYTDPEFNWDGTEMPSRKAAYWSLIPSHSGGTWVTRPGASLRLGDCVEDPLQEAYPAANERPCWDAEMIVDVFGADGRYLGEVDVPDGVRTGAFVFHVDGNRVVAVAEDEAGVYRVKRYRLAIPAHTDGSESEQ